MRLSSIVRSLSGHVDYMYMYMYVHVYLDRIVLSVVYVVSDEEAMRLIFMEVPRKKSSAPVINDESSILHIHTHAHTHT